MHFGRPPGPPTNLTLRGAAAVGAKLLYESGPQVTFYEDLPLGTRILFSFAVVNLFLGLFNLLPIPPLDGSALLERVLPAPWLPNGYKFRPYGFLVLFLLVFSTGVISEFLNPFVNQLFDFVFR
jgi:Zn-dependent protease